MGERIPVISNGYLWSYQPEKENYNQINDAELPENLDNTLNIFVRGDWILDYEMKTDAQLKSVDVDVDHAKFCYELNGKTYHREIKFDGYKITDITDLPDASYEIYPRGLTVFHHRDWYRMPDIKLPEFKEDRKDHWVKYGLDGIKREFSVERIEEEGKKGVEISVFDDFPDEFVSPYLWIDKLNIPKTGDENYDRAIVRSIQSLAKLMIYAPDNNRHLRSLVAGYPVFPSIFGRDSDITNMGLVYLDPHLVRENLEFRLSRLGKRYDPPRAEEPGRAFHEYNIDELTSAGLMNQFPNYIGCDESPLLGVSIARYVRITGDTDLIREQKENIRELISYVLNSTDSNGFISFKGDLKDKDGKPVYFTRNHTWRDSNNGVLNPDGSYPEQPLRTLWDQSALYGMLVEFLHAIKSPKGNEFLNILGYDDTFIEKIDDLAKKLKENVNRYFWMDDLDAYAIALNSNLEQVRTVNSDVCLGLYYGLFDKDKAERLVKNTLMNSQRLLDKYGIRSISKEHQDIYSSDGYHLGGVWPFQTSIAAIGLERYGYKKEGAVLREANREIIRELGDLPELIMADQDRPTRRKGSSEPQAWSAAAILLTYYE